MKRCAIPPAARNPSPGSPLRRPPPRSGASGEGLRGPPLPREIARRRVSPAGGGAAGQRAKVRGQIPPVSQITNSTELPMSTERIQELLERARAEVRKIII